LGGGGLPRLLAALAGLLLALATASAAGLQGEVVFSKSIHYSSGFSKEFKVYSLDNGEGLQDYRTEITLNYTNKEEARQDVTVSDAVPLSILSDPSQISFDQSPSSISSSNGISFGWALKSINTGEKVSFSYSFARPLTEQMAAGFSAPLLLPTAKQPKSGAGLPGEGLLASIFTFKIFDIPLTMILAGLFALALGIVVLGFLVDRD
jgi:hypothetical protein